MALISGVAGVVRINRIHSAGARWQQLWRSALILRQWSYISWKQNQCL